MKERACKECKRLTDLEVCPVCKAQTSHDWIGYVRVVSPEESEVARRLGIPNRGRYALKVR